MVEHQSYSNQKVIGSTVYMHILQYAYIVTLQTSLISFIKIVAITDCVEFYTFLLNLLCFFFVFKASEV